ncbi:hypothetical protein AB0B10_25465 [Micromonospora arborensis]|uniref:hypothetical protein n=1 Tax=Micromonospora arborensis TaxID=2116518 RepID=UPI0033D20CC3
MTGKAAAAWAELNDRQQGTLSVIYYLDQEIEETRNRARAAGEWDRQSAAEWRRIDFAYEHVDGPVGGETALQAYLAAKGWHSQGNGSTMAALADRGLITRGSRWTGFSTVYTVTMTRHGRAVARAGTSIDTGRAPKAALSQRAWEVLAMLWSASLRGKPLDWRSSSTIDNVLIKKHVPPLAQWVPGGCEITDRGKDFYREHYAAHVAAHPDVRAPHPDGAAAEPWPARVDEILGAHRQLYEALTRAWTSAHDMLRDAEKEADAETPKPFNGLPTVAADQIAARHRLWQDTARQRVQLATEHTADLEQRAVRAARSYAVAALAAFQAAVAGSDPLAGLHEPNAEDDGWDEPRLVLPAETGILAIDAQVKKLHAAAVGRPLRRRGPAPKFRGVYARRSKPLPKPGSKLVALAAYLCDHTYDGALRRRLHGAA